MKRIISFAILAAAAGAASAGVGEGKALVDKNCFRCHGTEVYTRADRRVTSLAGLHKQVRRCELALGLTWFDDQIDSVADYLNLAFYKYK
jgi:cytochrome c553